MIYIKSNVTQILEIADVSLIHKVLFQKVHLISEVNDRNGISPKPDRNRNMEFLPNRNRTGTETQYRNN